MKQFSNQEVQKFVSVCGCPVVLKSMFHMILSFNLERSIVLLKWLKLVLFNTLYCYILKSGNYLRLLNCLRLLYEPLFIVVKSSVI